MVRVVCAETPPTDNKPKTVAVSANLHAKNFMVQLQKRRGIELFTYGVQQNIQYKQRPAAH
jgi:hypothetical protein